MVSNSDDELSAGGQQVDDALVWDGETMPSAPVACRIRTVDGSGAILLVDLEKGSRGEARSGCFWEAGDAARRGAVTSALHARQGGPAAVHKQGSVDGRAHAAAQKPSAPVRSSAALKRAPMGFLASVHQMGRFNPAAQLGCVKLFAAPLAAPSSANRSLGPPPPPKPQATKRRPRPPSRRTAARPACRRSVTCHGKTSTRCSSAPASCRRAGATRRPKSSCGAAAARRRGEGLHICRE